MINRSLAPVCQWGLSAESGYTSTNTDHAETPGQSTNLHLLTNLTQASQGYPHMGSHGSTTMPSQRNVDKQFQLLIVIAKKLTENVNEHKHTLGSLVEAMNANQEHLKSSFLEEQHNKEFKKLV
jgi:hypothetical protein